MKEKLDPDGFATKDNPAAFWLSVRDKHTCQEMGNIFL